MIETPWRSRTTGILARCPIVAAIFLAVLLSACAVKTDIRTAPEGVANPELPQHLFVFFDGTKNNPKSETNVWKLFNLVNSNAAPNTKSFYVEGVGNARNPLTGMILGLGMEKRIKQAYRFLTANYRKERGDQIYIFGFSRGAHQARTFAGLLSYAGIPDLPEDQRASFQGANRIVEITKGVSDKDSAPFWKAWTPESGPLLAERIEDLAMQSAEVAFLGVWDTVPGSFFKKFETCKEAADGKGDRYKSGSYPPIHVIAHAVAIDEKRSRYKPLLLCEPYPSAQTKTHERWFPGAHSDVGGGYKDAGGPTGTQPPLSAASLNWMVSLLEKSYPLSPAYSPVDEDQDPLAPIHWSIGSFPANLLSRCKNREVPLDARDASFERRQAKGIIERRCKEG